MPVILTRGGGGSELFVSWLLDASYGSSIYEISRDKYLTFILTKVLIHLHRCIKLISDILYASNCCQKTHRVLWKYSLHEDHSILLCCIRAQSLQGLSTLHELLVDSCIRDGTDFTY